MSLHALHTVLEMSIVLEWHITNTCMSSYIQTLEWHVTSTCMSSCIQTMFSDLDHSEMSITQGWDYQWHIRSAALLCCVQYYSEVESVRWLLPSILQQCTSTQECFSKSSPMVQMLSVPTSGIDWSTPISTWTYSKCLAILFPFNEIKKTNHSLCKLPSWNFAGGWFS